ncbi:MAG: efflux RND transporter periplasmic adaptor subunit [Acidobacteriota bacterium]|nr:efflux RND transporter periplasmic adaptor subunit [Acidobacteriota bacterium]
MDYSYQSIRRGAVPPLAALAIFALVLLAALGLAACGRSTAAGPQGMPPAPVKVHQVENSEVGNTSEYVATIKSRNSATIMSDVEGWIFGIHVHSGDFVKRGQTLMEIDPRRQQASVSSQESQRASKQAALDWAKFQLTRSKTLYESGVVSKQDLDQAQTTYDSAVADVKSMDAQVNQQQVQLKYYSVFAPTDGIVGDIPVHVGDRVTNTTPLTTIDERSGLEVYISIPSERAHEIKMGAPVDVLDNSGKVLLQTQVYFISPQIETSTQSVLAKAPADKAANVLRAMQLVRARITWSTHSGITVPVVAVARVSGQFFAFVAEQDNGKIVARQRPLQLGEIVGNDYVVLSGLQPGDNVIVAGTQSLADGAPVAIQQ